jgi:hypothetical protein
VGADAVLAGIAWLLIGVRAGSSFLPGTWLWGMNLDRFTPVAVVAGLGALALAVGFALTPRKTSRPHHHGRGAFRRAGVAAWCLGVMVVLATFPDQAHFVGDSRLRDAAFELHMAFDRTFPQALILDRWLHWDFPHAAASALKSDPRWIVGIIGVLEGGLFAYLAYAIAGALGRRHTAWRRLTIIGGAYLALFTGYSKPTVELCLLTLTLCYFGVQFLRRGRGFAGMALAATLALGFHRLGVALIVPPIVAAIMGRRLLWRRRSEAIVGIAILLLGYVLFLPRIVSLMATFDYATNINSAIAQEQGGVLSAALSPLHLVDIVNVTLFLTPLIVLLPVSSLRALRVRGLVPSWRLWLWIVAACYLPILLFVQVNHGLFRDWDIFAGWGVSVAVLTSAYLAAQLDLRRGVVPICILALVPAATLIMHHRDSDAVLRRVYTFVRELPRRPVVEGSVWDYIGLESLRLRRWPEAEEAFGHLVEQAPH